jgi:hypothetical protein
VIEQGETSAAYSQQVELSFSDAPRSLEPNWTNTLAGDDTRQTFGSVG